MEECCRFCKKSLTVEKELQRKQLGSKNKKKLMRTISSCREDPSVLIIQPVHPLF